MAYYTTNIVHTLYIYKVHTHICMDKSKAIQSEWNSRAHSHMFVLPESKSQEGTGKNSKAHYSLNFKVVF